MFTSKKHLLTYQHQLQNYPQFFPQLVRYVLNNGFKACLNINIHLSTLTTTRTTSIYMINNIRRK